MRNIFLFLQKDQILQHERIHHRCYKHWLVANIPEERIYAAEEFASYTISTRAYEPGRYLTQSYYTQFPHPAQLEFLKVRLQFFGAMHSR